MVNAYEELINKLSKYNKDKESIKCAYIECGKTIILKIDFSDEEYETFLKELDFEYDAGFGRQELFGNVWFKDNSWFERHEYDGSEKWKFKSCPKIPDKCLRE